VEHFRGEVNQRAGLGLDIEGVDRDGMAILESDDWPGNVRELEAVVKRAMVLRRDGWVTPEDIVLPRLRRDRLARALQSLGTTTAAQEQALRLAASRGEVRRGIWWRSVGSHPRRRGRRCSVWSARAPSGARGAAGGRATCSSRGRRR